MAILQSLRMVTEYEIRLWHRRRQRYTFPEPTARLLLVQQRVPRYFELTNAIDHTGTGIERWSHD